MNAIHPTLKWKPSRSSDTGMNRYDRGYCDGYNERPMIAADDDYCDGYYDGLHDNRNEPAWEDDELPF